MSKLDAQRAMREAKYARDRARAQERTGSAPVRAAARPPVAPPVPAAAASASAAAKPATDALCGHRSMNGRTCTREAGHSEKNHRYS